MNKFFVVVAFLFFVCVFIGCLVYPFGKTEVVAGEFFLVAVMLAGSCIGMLAILKLMDGRGR